MEEAARKCLECKTVLPRGARYCPSCGQDQHDHDDLNLVSAAEVASDLIEPCPYCQSTWNEINSGFCGNCGYPLKGTAEQSRLWLIQRVRKLEKSLPDTALVSDNFFVRLFTFALYCFLTALLLGGFRLILQGLL